MAVLNSPSTGNGAEVNTNLELKTAVSAANGSTVAIISQNDATQLRAPRTSVNYRFRVGLDTILMSETFNHSTQNTSNWSYTFATMTASQPGAGTVNFGTVQGTTAGHGAFLRTFQYFPLYGGAPLIARFTMGQFTSPLVANEDWNFGFGLPSAAATLPTDSVYCQLTTAGLILYLQYNGTTTSSGSLASLASFTVGTLYKMTLVIGERNIEVWRDDILLGALQMPAAQGQPFQQVSLPVFMHKRTTGAVSNTNTMRVSDITIFLNDIQFVQPASHQAAAWGQMAYQGQNGSTVGSTQAIGTITTGSSAIPTSAAGSNTAANATGLGGTGAINAAAGAATDYIATSYQNPASTINIVGRNLYITGVRISAINTGAAVAITPTTLMWNLGFGHTAVSMQTAETGSFATATTKTPRRIVLGFQSAAVGAAVGALYAPDIYMPFNSPIVVRPGEFINTFFKQIIGTATASQTITYCVTFDGYWW